MVDNLDLHRVFVSGHGDFDRVSLRRPLERIRHGFGGRELEIETFARIEPARFRDVLHGRAKLSRGRRPIVEPQIDVRSLPRQSGTPEPDSSTQSSTQCLNG